MSCDWPVNRDCLLALPAEDDDTYAAKLAAQNAATDLAVAVLWALSGRRFGICEAIARPCPVHPYPAWWLREIAPGSVDMFVPVFWDGQWRNLTCGCRRRCDRRSPRAVHLPGPAVDIVTVTIGTTVLDEEDYVLEGDVLYRKGENWPHQDLGRPLGEDHTWSVLYDRGETVPPGVETLTGLLAKEFLAACSNDKCRLPRNITGVSRNGVTYQVYNPAQLYATGKTGLAEVDLWLAAINPYHLMSAPKVL